MKLKEIAEKLELERLTPVFDKDVTGVYISDMVSDVIANAKAEISIFSTALTRWQVATKLYEAGLR